MTSKTMIMGIDPGVTGAIALFCCKENKIREVYDIPVTVKENKRKEVDYYNCAGLIDAWAPQTMYAIIEDVHSMPEQGVVSTFNFGRTSGALLGMLASSLIKFHRVKPSVWKAQLGLTHDKKLCIERANNLFGMNFGNKDGRAEAALLTHFGRMVLKFG